MLVAKYRTKEELVRSLGQPLHFESANLLVNDYHPFGTVAVRGPGDGDNPPWCAEVTLIGGRIVEVE